MTHSGRTRTARGRQGRLHGPPRGSLTVGPLKFKGDVWAFVALAGVVMALGCILVAALLIVTAWVSPAEIISVVDGFAPRFDAE